MRFVVVSDTHNKEGLMPESLPDGDVLLHCGDMTRVGKDTELAVVNKWFGNQPHKTKIAIAGNHDIGLDIL